jgi:hypothetical protein
MMERLGGDRIEGYKINIREIASPASNKKVQ